MQNQNELKCEGCGQQFNNRQELDKHQQNCAAYKSKSASGQGQNRPQATGGQQQGGSGQHQGGSGQQQHEQPRTHGAGGGQNPQR